MLEITKTGIIPFLRQYGTGPAMPKIASTYKGGVVVCGDARCIWDDLERFGCADKSMRGKVWKSGWHFMLVNKVVETFPGDAEHAFSNEPNTLMRFMQARRCEYVREFNVPQQTHSISPGCKWTWPWGGHGTSGLGAVLTALALGYDQVVLAGMPLDDGPHNGEPPWRRSAFASSEAAGPAGGGMDSHWKTAKQLAFEGKVKSMSGRTRDWLGSP